VRCDKEGGELGIGGICLQYLLYPENYEVWRLAGNQA